MGERADFRPLLEGLAALKAKLPQPQQHSSVTKVKPKAPKSAVSASCPPAKGNPFAGMATSEVPNFAFGSNTFRKTIRDYRPIILSLARNGVRKPGDVSKSLNSKGLKTACGGIWTERLTLHLLKMIFENSGKSDTEIDKLVADAKTKAFNKAKERNAGKKLKKATEKTPVKLKKSNVKSPLIKPLSIPQAFDDKAKKRKQAFPSSLNRSHQQFIAKIDVTTFVDKALHEISGKSPAELVKMWRNCVDKLANSNLSKWHADALRLMTAIEEAWSVKPFKTKLNFEDFAWPDTHAVAGRNKGIDIDQDEGMLSYLEYRVGRVNGVSANVRHIILARIFESKLPFVFAPEYMAEWGEPNTSNRLRKMAESLASFARNLKRRENEMYDDAIKQWEADLSFLHERYYLSRHNFGWPATDI